jgi:hypothetical protein
VSYLGPLRLHFAGRFQAAVSTVNNDPAHYDNTTFAPSDQELEGPHGAPPNGWFNPRGDADWRLIGCKVTSAWLADGRPVQDGDPVLSMSIADSDRAAPAKLVDLDPCQQMVSTIWGLEMRIADRSGSTLLRGAYEPAAFFDIWARAAGGGGDINACAMYQSVLGEVEWGDVGGSPFLSALQEASPSGVLSVKFMVDGYNMKFGDPEFTRGRIVGTIGPASSSEPKHMVVGRQFVAKAHEVTGFFRPAGGINSCAAVVDEATARTYLDLGNALPTTTPGGEIEKVGELVLYAGEDPICPVPYSGEGWYERTAGIAVLPADRALSAKELGQIEGSPLSLRGPGHFGIAEAPIYVQADTFVFHCDPGDTATVRFHASHLGRPYAGADVLLSADPSQLQGESKGPLRPGVPAHAIRFPATVKTDADGVAVAAVATSDPGGVRRIIDGQVYGIRAKLADDRSELVNPCNFVSLLLWSAFEPDEPPTWHGCLQPIFQQYANLYPVMQGFLDLSSYEDVCANRKLLLLAFGLEIGNPNSMPVTRDLSSARRATVLRWLESTDAAGKPLLGEAPAAPSPGAARREASPAETAAISHGGKAAAAARRLIVAEEAG